MKFDFEKFSNDFGVSVSDSTYKPNSNKKMEFDLDKFNKDFQIKNDYVKTNNSNSNQFSKLSTPIVEKTPTGALNNNLISLPTVNHSISKLEQDRNNSLQNISNNYAPATKIDPKKELEVLGNLGKNVLNTSNALLNGAINSVEERILDPMLQFGSSGLNPYYWFHPEDLEQHQRIAQELIQKDASQSFIDNQLGYGNVLSNNETVQDKLNKGALIKSDNFGGNVFKSIGNMLPSIMLGNMGAGKLGTITATGSMGIGAYGSGLEEAYNEGANRIQADLYGLGNAAVETMTEWATGGIPGVNKLKNFALDNLADKGLNKISNEVAREVLRAGYKMVGEGSEEALSEWINPFLKNAIYTDGEKVNWNEVMQSFLAGAISGGILEAPINYSNIKSAMNSKKTYTSVNNELLNTQQNMLPSINNINEQKTLSSESLNSLKINESNPSKYEYLPTANEKMNNLRKSASQYFNNSNQTNDLLNTIDKVIKDKGYNVLFDDSISNKENKMVNAQITTLQNGEVEIKINPNSTKAGEFLLMHEITHSIENGSIKNLIIDYASKHNDFDTALKDLQQTYGVTDVTSEVVADISAQLFGNQEFINNLSMEKPNIFKQIYNKIIELANKFTGNSRYDLFVKDLKQKWEYAYRNTTTEQAVNNLSNEVKMSKKMGGYYPEINVDISNISKFNIKNINDLTEVQDKIYNYYKDKYISTELQSKPIKNIDTDMNIEIWKTGIYETFGNKNYYKNLSQQEKKIKLATMDNLAKMIKYGEIRSQSAPNYHNPNSPAIYYYLEHPIKIDGINYMVNMDIRKVPNVNGRFYIHSIDTKKIGASKSQKTPRLTAPISENNISQSNNNVKSEILPKYSMQNVENNTMDFQKSNKWEKYLENNYKSTGTRTNMKDIRLENRLPKYSNIKAIENRNNVDYTTSRGEINGEKKNTTEIGSGSAIRRGTNQTKNDVKRTSSKQKNTTLSKGKRTEWSNFERQATNQRKKELNTQEKQLNNKIKHNFNKEIVFFDEKGMKHQGGASLSNSNIIYVSSNVNIQDQIFIAYHEVLESDIAHNPVLNEKYIDIAIDEIMNDGNFKKIKENFVKGQSDEMKIYSDYMIAKDVLCDINANKQSGVALDYDISLSSETMEIINYNLQKFYKELNNRTKTEVRSKFSQNIAESINQNKNIDDLFKKEYPELKMRKWVETSTTSDVVDNKIMPEELNISKITYEVKSNKKTLETVNRVINTNGYDESVKKFDGFFESNQVPTAEDITLGERLIQEALNKNDYETAGELIEKVAIMGTELGQAVQALSIIQKLTPQGQLGMIQKTVNRLKKTGMKGVENIEVTPEMVEKILSTMQNDGSFDQKQLETAVDEVSKEIANQIPPTTLEKIDAWRYLSMLGNPKTHLRNLVSNMAMSMTRELKNITARGIETLASKKLQERTKTFKKATDVVKDFAKQSAIDMKKVIGGESKYTMSTKIKYERDMFKNKFLKKINDINSNALEAEDWYFSRKAYEQSLAEYLTANNIKTKEQINSNSSLVEKAKMYAVEEAQKATFRQYSKLANTISHIENSSKFWKLAIGSNLPFKKTPINVAKTGLNYSLPGLLKTLTYDFAKLSKGSISANQFIDNLAQGLSGTSIMLLGYMLGNMGILSGSSDDDKEGKYDNQLGNQAYSINLFGHSYTLDWLSPVSIPLFTGVELQKRFEEKNFGDFNAIFDTMLKTLDPMTSMSFLQGLNNTFNSYEDNKLMGFAKNTLKSYTGQFLPTVSGQIARTIDPIQRSTSTSKNSPATIPEEIMRSSIAKIPFLSMMLEPATDIWGNEKKRSDNILARAFDNFISPGYTKKIIETQVDKELKDLYQTNGNGSVLPSIPKAYLTYNGESYKMSAKEFTEFKKEYGQKAYELINDIIKNSDYKESEEKEKIIEDAYSYAREKAKINYFKQKGIDYSPKEKWINDINRNISVDKYVLYKKNDLDLIQSDKDSNGVSISGTAAGKKAFKIMNNNNLNKTEKQYLLSTISSSQTKVSYEVMNKLTNDQSVYNYYFGLSNKDCYNNLVLKTNMNQNSYINIKNYANEIKQKYKGDQYKNVRYNKIFKYIDNQKLTKNQKIIMLGLSGYSIKNYKNEVFEYIDSLKISKSEKEWIWKYLYGGV